MISRELRVFAKKKMKLGINFFELSLTGVYPKEENWVAFT